MTTQSSTNNSDTDKWEKYPHLWEEYKYRHDLCWRHLFRLTWAVIVLIITPYVYGDVVKQLEEWILWFPIITLILIVFGCIWMNFEITLFIPIRDEFWKLQETIFNFKSHRCRKKFRLFVNIYIGLLLGLGCFNFYYVKENLIQQTQQQVGVKGIYDSWLNNKKKIDSLCQKDTLNLFLGGYSELLKELDLLEEANNLQDLISKMRHPTDKKNQKIP